MSLLNQASQRLLPSLGTPALCGLQQQWRSMSMQEKAKYPMGVSTERGERLMVCTVRSHGGLATPS